LRVRGFGEPFDGVEPPVPLAGELGHRSSGLVNAVSFHLIENLATLFAAADQPGPFEHDKGFVTPVAFNSERIRARTDGQLYWLITYGIGNMPAFQTVLSQRDVWTLVHAATGSRARGPGEGEGRPPRP
jgi:hypothetical protein